MIVTDASAVAAALTERTQRGDQVRRRLSGEVLAAPSLVHAEVLSTIRGLLLGDHVTTDQATAFVRSLQRYPVRLGKHRPLLVRAWELRHDLSAYDALYVALAERLDVTLVTTDARIKRAPGIKCRVEVFEH